MRVALVSAFAFFLSGLPQAFAGESATKLIGLAATEDGKPAYVEEHTLIYGADHRLARVETVYRRPGPDGKEIARLDSDFSKYAGGYLPAYHFVDLRTQRENGLNWLTPIPATPDGEGLIEMFRKKAADDSIKKETMKVKAGMVTGEGIFFYILDRLQEISSSDGAKVRILLPARLDDVGLRIRLKEKAKAGTIKIDIDNWFLRIFVPSIEVDYDPVEKRILEYRGVSVINSDEDKVQEVKVHFTYP
jgi:hypothetical protein